jgi:hypothetical protein
VESGNWRLGIGDDRAAPNGFGGAYRDPGVLYQMVGKG